MGEHIRILEERLDILSSQLMQEKQVAKRNQLDAELRAVQSALALYRSAVETEKKVFEQNP